MENSNYRAELLYYRAAEHHLPTPTYAKSRSVKPRAIPRTNTLTSIPKKLPLVHVSIAVDVVGITSSTVLTHIFTNDTNETVLESTYRFPLYEGSALVAFRCWTNKTLLEGIVKAKSEAEREYVDARSRNHVTAMVEEHTPEIFELSLGNIQAGCDIRVEIRYVSQLKADLNAKGILVTIPTSIAPRYGASPATYRASFSDTEAEDCVSGMKIEVEVSSPVPIRSLESRTHPISVTLGDSGKPTPVGTFRGLANSNSTENATHTAKATLSDIHAGLGKDFVLLISTSSQSNILAPRALLEQEIGRPDRTAMAVSFCPLDIFTTILNPAQKQEEILLLADLSGSMLNKRAPLKRALNILLRGIPTNGYYINILSFGSTCSSLWPKSVVYTAETLKEASLHIQTEFDRDMGGTEILHAIKSAVKTCRTENDITTEIIVITDGEVWAVDDTIKFVESTRDKLGDKIRFFCLGIGDAVSHQLVEGIGKEGGGFAEVIAVNSPGNWDERLLRMLKGALTSSNGTIQVELNKCINSKSLKSWTTVSSEETNSLALLYSPIQAPCEFRSPHPFSLQSVYFLFDLNSEQYDAVTLSAVCSSGERVVKILPIERVEVGNSMVNHLAAKAAVKDLETGKNKLNLGRGSRRAELGRLVAEEAVKIGIRWSIVGKWTSFVAIECSGTTSMATRTYLPGLAELTRNRRPGKSSNGGSTVSYDSTDADDSSASDDSSESDGPGGSGGSGGSDGPSGSGGTSGSSGLSGSGGPSGSGGTSGSGAPNESGAPNGSSGPSGSGEPTGSRDSSGCFDSENKNNDRAPEGNTRRNNGHKKNSGSNCIGEGNGDSGKDSDANKRHTDSHRNSLNTSSTTKIQECDSDLSTIAFSTQADPSPCGSHTVVQLPTTNASCETLYRIILCQEHGGNFQFNTENEDAYSAFNHVLSAFSSGVLNEIKQILIPVISEEIEEDVCATIATIVYIQNAHSGQPSTWGLVIDKARTWLRGVIGPFMEVNELEIRIAKSLKLTFSNEIKLATADSKLESSRPRNQDLQQFGTRSNDNDRSTNTPLSVVSSQRYSTLPPGTPHELDKKSNVKPPTVRPRYKSSLPGSRADERTHAPISTSPDYQTIHAFPLPILQPAAFSPSINPSAQQTYSYSSQPRSPTASSSVNPSAQQQTHSDLIPHPPPPIGHYSNYHYPPLPTASSSVNPSAQQQTHSNFIPLPQLPPTSYYYQFSLLPTAGSSVNPPTREQIYSNLIPPPPPPAPPMYYYSDNHYPPLPTASSSVDPFVQQPARSYSTQPWSPTASSSVDLSAQQTHSSCNQPWSPKASSSVDPSEQQQTHSYSGHPQPPTVSSSIGASAQPTYGYYSGYRLWPGEAVPSSYSSAQQINISGSVPQFRESAEGTPSSNSSMQPSNNNQSTYPSIGMVYHGSTSWRA